MSDQHGILNGKLWGDFCDELKTLGPLLSQPGTPDDLQNRALGYRYLTGLLRAGLEMTVDYANPQFPCFFSLADDSKKMLNDNPDSFYQNCVVDGRFNYRISGTMGDTRFNIGTKGSATDTSKMVSTGQINMEDIDCKSDGSFEIIASIEEQPGNWLPMQPGTRSLIVRQTFADRKNEKPADMRIECLNPEAINNTLNPQTLAPALEAALGFIRSTVDLNVNWMGRYSAHINELPEDDQALCQAAGGDPNIHYYQSYWSLAPDEALVVLLEDIPPCDTWNMQLSNFWMQSLDYRFFDVCVNKHGAHYRKDGSVEIVVAHHNPGPKYPNWLNTCGHDQGGMLARYIGSINPPNRLPTKVIKFSELN